jgi:AraC-like DNA-binding protein
MDLLRDIMESLRTRGLVHGRLEFRGPFGFRFPVEMGHFFIVTRGTCYLHTTDETLLRLEVGDFAFLPTSNPCSLLSAIDVEEIRSFNDEESESYVQSGVIHFDGQMGAPVSLISGCFKFSSPESRLLVEHLPPTVHLQASGPHVTPWTHAIIQLMVNETIQRGLGSTTVIDRLAEVLFVHALRDYFERPRPSQSESWLRAMGDAKIGPSLNRIHSDLAYNWTVQELAHSVGMSRSAFAAKFKSVVGTTPLDHLTKRRMLRAAGMITQTTSARIDMIAAAVGYESESSFRKAFRNVMGASPSEYRKRSRPKPLRTKEPKRL